MCNIIIKIMATLEDKLMGEKLEYYCSSSEDEDDGKASNAPPQEPSFSKRGTHWTGTSQNTGPKGVVQDWQLYKQLESQQREENDKQRLEMMKKLSITTSTKREDEERKKEEELEAELAELLDEEILQQFQKQRMAEMLQMCGQQKVFGKVIQLATSEDFLNAIEKENPNTTVIIHIYEKNVNSCNTLNTCLDTLASEYKNIKFCKIISSTAGMSSKFKSKGLPAILVYKSNQMIGNFVRVTDELTDDFFASDLESFLIENGMISDKNIVGVI